jgi:uncharacterized membrane protein HdeD (DUF308 family)
MRSRYIGPDQNLAPGTSTLRPGGGGRIRVTPQSLCALIPMRQMARVASVTRSPCRSRPERKVPMTSAHADPRLTVPQAGGRWLSRTFLPPWWLLLISGLAWMIVSLILLRFDYTSVYSISLLFGFVAIAAGLFEIGAIFMAPGWWKLLHGVLAFAFTAAGIVAFASPGDTFVSLAAVFSFFLVFAGAFDIIMSIAYRRETEIWWLQLVGGIIEISLGFWAAGYYGRSAILLVAWVAAFAIIRGVRDLIAAFRVRELQHPKPAD